jgi:hypothetical protein
MANRNPNLRQPNRRSAQNPQNPQQEQVPSGHNEADFPVQENRRPGVGRRLARESPRRARGKAGR